MHSSCGFSLCRGIVSQASGTENGIRALSSLTDLSLVMSTCPGLRRRRSSALSRESQVGAAAVALPSDWSASLPHTVYTQALGKLYARAPTACLPGSFDWHFDSYARSNIHAARLPARVPPCASAVVPSDAFLGSYIMSACLPLLHAAAVPVQARPQVIQRLRGVSSRARSFTSAGPCHPPPSYLTYLLLGLRSTHESMTAPSTRIVRSSPLQKAVLRVERASCHAMSLQPMKAFCESGALNARLPCSLMGSPAFFVAPRTWRSLLATGVPRPQGACGGFLERCCGLLIVHSKIL